MIEIVGDKPRICNYDDDDDDDHHIQPYWYMDGQNEKKNNNNNEQTNLKASKRYMDFFFCKTCFLF